MKKENLVEGILKTLKNAQELCDESEILLKNGKFARSYTLSHLAREEFSKCFILYRSLFELICGKQVDWKKVRKKYQNHKDKIKQDGLTSMGLFGKEIKKQGGNVTELFSVINKKNEWKNTSLYVDWKNDNFISPSDSFNKNKAERNLDIAVYRIKILTPRFIEMIQLSPKIEKEIKAKFSNIDFDETIDIEKTFNYFIKE